MAFGTRPSRASSIASTFFGVTRLIPMSSFSDHQAKPDPRLSATTITRRSPGLVTASDLTFGPFTESINRAISLPRLPLGAAPDDQADRVRLGLAPPAIDAEGEPRADQVPRHAHQLGPGGLLLAGRARREHAVGRSGDHGVEHGPGGRLGQELVGCRLLPRGVMRVQAVEFRIDDQVLAREIPRQRRRFRRLLRRGRARRRGRRRSPRGRRRPEGSVAWRESFRERCGETGRRGGPVESEDIVDGRDPARTGRRARPRNFDHSTGGRAGP